MQCADCLKSAPFLTGVTFITTDTKMCEYCRCSRRVSGCDNPESLCACLSCDCRHTLSERQHEVDRINQFKAKARDDQHFKQLIFGRAVKCGPEKRERFINFLKRIGRTDLSSFVEMCMKERKE